MDSAEEEFQLKKQQIVRKLKRRLKTGKKALQKVEQQLNEARQWQDRQREALVLQSNLYQIPKGAKQIALTDWETNQEVTYAFKDDPHKEVARRFRKSKKLKDGLKPLEHQLEKGKEWQASVEAALIKVEAAETEDVLEEVADQFDLHERLPSEKKNTPVLPYRKFISATGIEIWVGKSAKDNDALTFTHANGSDWWMHVNEYSGSHVVIRASKPDDQTLQDAMQLAIAYSKMKGRGKVEVCLTQCKYVSRYKGAKPGTVRISKHKNILSELNLEKVKAIKERPLPTDLRLLL